MINYCMHEQPAFEQMRRVHKLKHIFFEQQSLHLNIRDSLINSYKFPLCSHCNSLKPVSLVLILFNITSTSVLDCLPFVNAEPIHYHLFYHDCIHPSPTAMLRHYRSDSRVLAYSKLCNRTPIVIRQLVWTGRPRSIFKSKMADRVWRLADALNLSTLIM